MLLILGIKMKLKIRAIWYISFVFFPISLAQSAYGLSTSERLEKAKGVFLENCEIIKRNHVYNCSCLSELYVNLPVHKKKVIKRDMFMDETELASYRNKIISEKSQGVLDKLDAFCDLPAKERKRTENIQEYIGQNSGILYKQYCKVRNTVNRIRHGTIRILNPDNAMQTLKKSSKIQNCIRMDYLDSVLLDERKTCIKKTNLMLKRISDVKGAREKYLLGNKTSEELCSCVASSHKEAIMSNYANLKYNSNFNSGIDSDNLAKCNKLGDDDDNGN